MKPIIKVFKDIAPEEVKDMLVIAGKLPLSDVLKPEWVSEDKLNGYSCKHVAAMTRIMVRLVVWKIRSTESEDCPIEEVWSASAFVLCGERKLIITAKHNVEGFDHPGRGIIFAYTHPQDSTSDSGEHFAKFVAYVGNTAVLELHALHSDSPLHAGRLAEVAAKPGDRIRVMGIANVNSGDSATRVLALNPGTVTAPCKDGLVPCDLTMFKGLSGGAMTTESGCVVALAEGADLQSAFATDLVNLRPDLEKMLRQKCNCGIADLVTDDPVSWAFTKIQQKEVKKQIHRFIGGAVTTLSPQWQFLCRLFLPSRLHSLSQRGSRTAAAANTTDTAVTTAASNTSAVATIHAAANTTTTATPAAVTGTTAMDTTSVVANTAAATAAISHKRRKQKLRGIPEWISLNIHELQIRSKRRFRRHKPLFCVELIFPDGSTQRLPDLEKASSDFFHGQVKPASDLLDAGHEATIDFGIVACRVSPVDASQRLVRKKRTRAGGMYGVLSDVCVFEKQGLNGCYALRFSASTNLAETFIALNSNTRRNTV